MMSRVLILPQWTEGLVIKTIVLSVVALLIVFSLQHQAILYRSGAFTHRRFITFYSNKTRPPVNAENTPRVALLFLCRAEVHNEPVWKAFFERAVELSFQYSPPNRSHVSFVERSKFFKKMNSPNRTLKESATSLDEENCTDKTTIIRNEMVRLTSAGSSGWSSLISKQNLFNVYTHPNLDYTFPENSIFYNTEVADRINTTNGMSRFRLDLAEFQLLKAALTDSQNQKFVLLSEACIPIHRPEVIYLQLISETKSRSNACGAFTTHVHLSRWNDNMKSSILDKSKWRKSAQWFALIRSHAELVIKENHVKLRFSKYCDGPTSAVCVSNEHYIPTTLAVYGLEDETDCSGHMTSAIWSPGWSHPLTYKGESVTPNLIQKLRNIKLCDVPGAQASASAFFKTSSNSSHCHIFNNKLQMKYSKPIYYKLVKRTGYRQMGYECRLFARKFSSAALADTLYSSLACNGVGLGPWC